MAGMLDHVQALVANGEVVVSAHGYDELVQDRLTVADVVAGIADARLIEEYPDYHKGPCVLVLQPDAEGNPVHVLWGIRRGTEGPAVVVTAYRPDPIRWSHGFTRRAS